VVAYYLGIVLLFTIVGGALCEPPAHPAGSCRRPGFGTAAGVLIVIIACSPTPVAAGI
jgi:hypothetical protein